MLLPTLAVQTRRLHDTNRSGWWLGGFYLLYVLYFVMLFGSMGSMLVPGAQPTDPSQVSGGMFGATMILGIVIFIYMITLLVFYCLPGTKGTNSYGDDPYGPDVEQVFA